MVWNCVLWYFDVLRAATIKPVLGIKLAPGLPSKVSSHWLQRVFCNSCPETISTGQATSFVKVVDSSVYRGCQRLSADEGGVKICLPVNLKATQHVLGFFRNCTLPLNEIQLKRRKHCPLGVSKHDASACVTVPPVSCRLEQYGRNLVEYGLILDVVHSWLVFHEKHWGLCPMSISTNA